MSPDFLANYLAVGPARARLGKEAEANLPVALFNVLPDHVPVELMEIAAQTRKECGELNDRLVRRKLRDLLDQLRQKSGPLAKGGFSEVRARLERAMKGRH